MKWLLIVPAALAGLALLMLVVGAFRPKSHVATVTARLTKPPEDVWRVIADIPKVPEWFGGVSAVERLPDRDGRAAWKETYDGSFHATVIHTVEQRPMRLVREIQPGGAFHGTWTFELAADGPDGTSLTVTERGIVENPFIRGMMVFHDNTKTTRDYVAALATRLGA